MNKKLVLIPARGGSKGIPNKNIKMFAGKPLIAHSLNLARTLFDDNDICVSTDSFEIMDVLNKYNYTAPFVRPSKISQDNSSMNEVLNHCIAFYKSKGFDYDSIIILQPTSPLRTKDQFIQCLNIFNKNSELLISVKETSSNPFYLMFQENNDGYLERIAKKNFYYRQEAPKIWEINGAFYILKIDSFLQKQSLYNLKTEKYIMDKESSIDIDDNHDWNLAEFFYNKK